MDINQRLLLFFDVVDPMLRIFFEFFGLDQIHAYDLKFVVHLVDGIFQRDRILGLIHILKQELVG